jgi:pSer/pThr/pTyr-binding forkhead associated (FHA) protein
MTSQLLLAGQVLVVLAIYLIIWRVMRVARRDLAGSQAANPVDSGDSTIMSAAEVERARRHAGIEPARLVVVKSPQLRPGQPFTIAETLSLGRSSTNDIVLDDPFVSSEHLKLVPPRTVVDLDSTNGTLLNDAPLKGRATMSPGDRIRIGETVFTFEAGR